MNKEIVAVDPREEAKLSAMLGASTTPNTNNERLPKLKANQDRKDEAGNALPIGHLFLANTDTPVYAEKVTVRPLSQMFQWIKYDPVAKGVDNKTILIPNFRCEALDMKGGTRCGKPTSKELKLASEEIKKKHENTTCFREVRALISYTGKNATGDTVTVEPTPAILMLKGTNFNPFEDEYLKRLPHGSNLYDYDAEVTAEELKNGSVYYYVMHFKPNLAKALPLDTPTFETMKVFAGLIEAENNLVTSMHQKALRTSQSDTDALRAVNGYHSSTASLEDELQDS